MNKWSQDEVLKSVRHTQKTVWFSVSHSMRFLCLMRFFRFKRHRSTPRTHGTTTTTSLLLLLLCVHVCVCVKAPGIKSSTSFLGDGTWSAGPAHATAAPALLHVTGGGFEGRRVLVLKGVSLQQRAVRESSVTYAAGEGALHAVRAHVHVERTLLREALAADGALERSHARVHHHVLQQVVAQRERPPADAALMRLLT